MLDTTELIESNLEELLELRGIDIGVTIKDNALLISDTFLFTELKDTYEECYHDGTHKLKPLNLRKIGTNIKVESTPLQIQIYKALIIQYQKCQDEELKAKCEPFLFVNVNIEDYISDSKYGFDSFASDYKSLKEMDIPTSFRNMGFILEDESNLWDELVEDSPQAFMDGIKLVIENKEGTGFEVLADRVKFFEDSQVSKTELTVGNRFINIDVLPTTVKAFTYLHSGLEVKAATIKLSENLSLPSVFEETISDIGLKQLKEIKTSVVFSNIDGIYLKMRSCEEMGITVKHKEIIYTYDRSIYKGPVSMEALLYNVRDVKELHIKENHKLLNIIDSLGYILNEETKFNIIKSVIFTNRNNNAIIQILASRFKYMMFGSGVSDFTYPYGTNDTLTHKPFKHTHRKPDNLVAGFLDTDITTVIANTKVIEYVVEGIEFGTNADEYLREILLYDRVLGQIFRQNALQGQILKLFIETALLVLTKFDTELEIHDWTLFNEKAGSLVDGVLLTVAIEENYDANKSR